MNAFDLDSVISYIAAMARIKPFYYLIDGLNPEKGEQIRQSLKALMEVDDARFSVNQGVVEVFAKKDMEDQVRLACTVAGTGFRTKVKKKDLY